MKQNISVEQLKKIDSDIIAKNLLKTGVVKHSTNELIRTEKFCKKITIGKKKWKKSRGMK